MKRRMFPGIVRNDNPGFLWYDGENVHENAYVLGKRSNRKWKVCTKSW